MPSFPRLDFANFNTSFHFYAEFNFGNFGGLFGNSQQNRDVGNVATGLRTLATVALTAHNVHQGNDNIRLKPQFNLIHNRGFNLEFAATDTASVSMFQVFVTLLSHCVDVAESGLGLPWPQCKARGTET